jgi:hypothetical protein
MDADPLLDEVLSLSESILRFAQAGDWIASAEQERLRRDLMTRCFAPGMRFADVRAAGLKIEKILRIDGQTLALGREQRQTVSASIGKLRQGRAAVTAYQRARR